MCGSAAGSRKLGSLPLLEGSAASEMIDSGESEIIPEKNKNHFKDDSQTSFNYLLSLCRYVSWTLEAV